MYKPTLKREAAREDEMKKRTSATCLSEIPRQTASAMVRVNFSSQPSDGHRNCPTLRSDARYDSSFLLSSGVEGVSTVQFETARMDSRKKKKHIEIWKGAERCLKIRRHEDPNSTQLQQTFKLM